MIKLETPRLTLIAGTLEMAEAELSDMNTLEHLVGAKFPSNWPPPLNDENSMKWFREYLKTNPGASGWVMWYICLRMPDNSLTAVGGGGFKGFPDENGTVEIGYSIMEKNQRNGYATEAVTALKEWAFTFPTVKKIVAQTFPELIPSRKVLEKCGFKFKGQGFEEGTILYEFIRAAY